MKGLFIPDITAEMFRNGCLEGIEALMAEGEIWDIDYTGWIPVSERLPEDGIAVLTTTENGEVYIDQVITDPYKERYFQSNTGYDNYQVIAWQPLPKPYKESEE